MAKDPWDMTDDELEAAFLEAKGEGTELPDTSEEFIVEDEQEEIIVDEHMEHPNEDSDDDFSSDETSENTEDDASETDKDNPDGDTEEVEEKTKSNVDAQEEEGQPEQTYKFRANGQEYEFTDSEMKQQFGRIFGQAMDYTKKMQQLKPYRQTIDAIESAGLKSEDVSLMIDALKGDKNAIAAVLKRTGVDALDLDTENSNYVAKNYGRNETELAIKDIVDDISGDKEYAVTHRILENQWDDKSRLEFVEDPNKIRLLHTDVKTGLFDILNPIAQKLKVYDGGKQSDLDYYKIAADQYNENQIQAQLKAQQLEQRAEMQRLEAQKIEEVKAREAKQRATKAAAAKRMAAAPTKKAAGTQTAQKNYLDISDEEFEEWYNSRVTDQY